MKLFVSHSNVDDKVVDEVKKIFENYNVHFWIDHHDQIGDNVVINEKIDNGLKNSTHFLLIWSKHAKKSEGVNQEIYAATSKGKKSKLKMIICRLDNTELPPSLSKFYYHRITKSNLKSEIEKIITKNRIPLDKQFNLLRQKIVKEYPKSDNKTIRTFSKFDGFKKSIDQSYVDLKSEEKSDRILEHVVDIVKNKKQQFVPVISDYGSGKSTLSHNLLYRICKSNPSDFIVFIALGNLPKHDEIHYVVEEESESERPEFAIATSNQPEKSNPTTRKLSKPIEFDDLIEDFYLYVTIEYDLIISLDEFTDLINKGKIMFILDAFDEMTQKLSKQFAYYNMKNIKELTQKGNLVFLTSRGTYLPQEMEEDLIENYHLLQIIDFDQEAIEKFVKKQFGAKTQKTKKFLKKIQQNNFMNLAQKPIFLSALCEIGDVEKYSIPNGARLLEILSYRWLQHDIQQNERKEEELLDIRHRISQILALVENKKNRPISIGDIIDIVNEEFSEDDIDVEDNLEKYYRDGRDSTFLTKSQHESYRFMLRTIMEYYLARRIVNTIKEGDFDKILDETTNVRFSDATYEFISNLIDIEWKIDPEIIKSVSTKNQNFDLLKEKENHGHIISKTIKHVQKNKIDPEPNMGNLVRILITSDNLTKNHDLQGLNLKYVKLDNLDLKGANLSETTLHRASLIDSNLRNVKMCLADIRWSVLDNSDLRNADLTHADLTFSKIRGGILREANLSNAIMPNSILDDSDLRLCRLNNSELRDAKLNKVFMNQTNFCQSNFGGCEINDSLIIDPNNLSKEKMDNLIRQGAIIK